jgi:hypothetical protein
MSNEAQRVVENHQTKRAGLEREFKASSESQDVQNLVMRARISTDLTFFLFAHLCSCVADAEKESVAAFTKQRELTDKIKRLTAESRDHYELESRELRELTEHIAQQQERAAETAALLVA